MANKVLADAFIKKKKKKSYFFKMQINNWEIF